MRRKADKELEETFLFYLFYSTLLLFILLFYSIEEKI